jgi:hypothetical protein
MSRIRYIGKEAVQLPTPFGYLVQPGDVVEVPDHLVHMLRQTSIGNVFAVTPGSAMRMPPADSWVDADAYAIAENEARSVDPEGSDVPVAGDSFDATPKLGAEKSAPIRAQKARQQAVDAGEADPVGSEEGSESEGAPA